MLGRSKNVISLVCMPQGRGVFAMTNTFEWANVHWAEKSFKGESEYSNNPLSTWPPFSQSQPRVFCSVLCVLLTRASQKVALTAHTMESFFGCTFWMGCWWVFGQANYTKVFRKFWHSNVFPEGIITYLIYDILLNKLVCNPRRKNGVILTWSKTLHSF